MQSHTGNLLGAKAGRPGTVWPSDVHPKVDQCARRPGTVGPSDVHPNFDKCAGR